MYRVLLPVDEHEGRARAQAEAVIEFARVTDALSIDVLYVHEDVGTPDVEWAAGGFAEEYIEEMNENVREYTNLPDSVDIVAGTFEEADIEFTIHETTGDPAKAILTIATEFDSDAIVVGIRRRSPVGKVIFGSVAQGVLIDSDIPVTVVPAG